MDFSLQKLEEFKAKHVLWERCLRGEDHNAIFNQIYQMVWNAAVFKVINESRRIAPANANGQKEINGMLHRFMDSCFFDSQFLAIRRLTDAGYAFGDPKKGIFSLMALLNDMRTSASLMTRENLFAVDGLEYDYDIVEKKKLAYILAQPSGAGYSLPNALDSEGIIRRHAEIDALVGCKPNQRTPQDSIPVEVLDCLIKKLTDASEDIVLHVKKYVAHSASPESREYDSAEEIKITLNHLWDAHRIICQVANFIDVYMISRASHHFLPIPQFNHFEFIENGLVPYENVKDLDDAWHKFQKETEQWGSWGIKELKSALA